METTNRITNWFLFGLPIDLFGSSKCYCDEFLKPFPQLISKSCQLHFDFTLYSRWFSELVIFPKLLVMGVHAIQLITVLFINQVMIIHPFDAAAKRFIVFENYFQNKRLEGSVVKKIRPTNFISCSSSCAKHPQCRSFNYCLSRV